jgi:hypothetical protein
MGKVVRDYYVVRIPDDAFDNDEARGQCAIREVEERSHKFVLPCTWTAKRLTATGLWQVCRTRSASTVRHRKGGKR